MRRTLPLLLSLALIALLLLLALRPEDALGERSGPPAAAPEGSPPPAQDSLEGGAESRLDPVARRAADGRGTPVEVHGRIVSAPAPADDGLEVFALRQPASHATLASWLDAANGGPGSALEAQLLARAPVDRSGNFRLPLDTDAQRLHLAVRGRFLYSPETTSVPADATEPLRLTATVGACVSVQAAPGQAEVRLELATDNGNFFEIARDDRFALQCEGSALEPFELRALPVDSEYTLALRADGYASRRTRIVGLAPGELRVLDVALRPGARIRGRVVDSTGAGVEGADVRALVGGRWLGLDDFSASSARSGATGAFQLEHVPGPRVGLRADAPGYRTSTKLELDVPESGVVEDVLLSLDEGGVLTGHVRWPDGTPATDADIEVRFDPAGMVGLTALGAQRGARGDASTQADGSFRVSGLGHGPFVLRARGRPVGNGPLHIAVQHGLRPGAGELSLVLESPPGLFGRVVDDEGQPIPAFELRLSKRVTTEVGPAGIDLRRAACEDADGRFFMPELERGQWQVEVLSAAHVTAEPVLVDLPGTSQESPLELRLARAARVTGVVLDPQGEPVAGARVELDAGMPAWQGGSSGQHSPAASCAADGSFELGGLAPGSFALRAAAHGFARGASVPLEVGPGETLADVALKLRVGGRITGELLDGDGRPAPGKMVFATEMKTFESLSTTTREAGLFEFETLVPGTWSLGALLAEASWGDSEDPFDTSAFGKAFVTSQATVAEGESVHVVLGEAPADPVRVHGRVTQDGAPYTGALVTFYPEGERLYERLVFTSLDDTGHYELVLDGAGHYVVQVNRIPGAMGQQQLVEFAEEIPAVAELRLDFEIPRGRISGRVVDGEGRGIAKARITLTVDAGVRSDSLFGGHYAESETDGEGRYDIDGLRPGVYRVSAGGASLFAQTGAGAEANFGRSTRGALVLDEGEWKRDVDFRLAGPGAIRVRVRDAADAAVAGATVFVRDAGGRFSEPISLSKTDATGHVTLGGLAQGSYTLLARAGGSTTPESEPVPVVAGGTAALELTLEAGSILWIKLKSSEGEELRASVSVLDEEGRELAGVFGLEELQVLYLDGGFSPTEHRLGPLPAGEYRVAAHSAAGASASKRIRLRGGKSEQRVILRLD